ncbi:MAG: PEP-CTERM-box response regulator transcription factor [Alphaproteobacteria bacterium]
MSADKPKLLIVEDDPGLQRQLRWSFDAFDVHIAGDRREALAEFQDWDPPVVTLDLGLPPDPDGASEGLATLHAILSESPQAKVIVVTGNEDRQNALKAVAMGAYDFYQKPINADVLGLIIGRAYHLYSLEAENRSLQRLDSSTPLDGFITGSPEVIRICKTIEKVAPADVSVLLLGESGTGKEVLARALHALSHRAKYRFLAINCAAIPENLLESELFGYERGAFTGAVKQTKGKIEESDGGTLFLDEIGDVPLTLQVKLLRFLQERVVERVGGRQEIPVDIRLVCATHQNLEELIAEGRFREDLYYRVSELVIRIPPLRERDGDAALLAHSFLARYARTLGKGIKGFTPDALASIASYPWPGNVRELENKIKRAIIMAETPRITAANLDLPSDAGLAPPISLKRARRDAEIREVNRALAQCNGNVSAAAKLLGISRPTLYDLMRQHGKV